MERQAYEAPQLVEIGTVVGSTFKSGVCCDGSQNFPEKTQDQGQCIMETHCPD